VAIRRQAVAEVAEAYDAGVAALAWSLDGDLLRPGDEAYDAARQVYDATFDRYPGLIVRADGAQDIVRAVDFARERELAVAVKSGGHSLAGHGTVDGGMLVDLSGMTGLQIDPANRVAHVEPGVTWAEYALAASKYGLATTSGDMGTVGVGGLALGGGIGWMLRKYGLTIDHVEAATVVTADGRLLRAGPDENADLYWALRGGGGNFGVATSFELRLDPVEQIVGGLIGYPIEQARHVLRSSLDYAAAAPDELTMMAYIRRVPPVPFIPAQHHGQLMVALLLVCAGDVPDGMQVIAPLRELGTPIADMVAPMQYPAIFTFTEQGGIKGRYHDDRSMFLDAVDEGALDTILEHGTRGPSPFSMVQLRVLGGAMARVSNDATAFAHRDKPYLLNIVNGWQDPAQAGANRAWTEEFWQAMRPRAAGAYVNFLGDEGELRVRDAYPPATYRRLVEIKNRYDPTNFFRLNQNIKPTV
jgi:FAD/FMN-containing dehydrogenase